MRGGLALALGLPDRAEQHFRTGMEWAKKMRSPIEAGRNLIGLARVAEARAEPSKEMLTLARQFFDSCGAIVYLEEMQPT